MVIKQKKHVELGTRIAKAIGQSGKKQVEFARELGVPPSNLSRWINGDVAPSYEYIIKIGNIAGVPLDWLLEGGEPLQVAEGRTLYKKAHLDSELSEILQLLKAHPQDKKLVLRILAPSKVSATAGEIIDGDFIFIPRVSGEISAGGGLLPDDTIEMRIAFKKDWIAKKGDPHNMSLIRVSGDSMEPTLCSGDIVLVDHNRNYVDPHGGIYALSMDSMIMLKRVQMMCHTQKLKIISDNEKYEPIETSPEQVSINGKVIWFAREIER